MVIDRECLEGHLNNKFLIHHGTFVQEIEIERLCVANVRERFDDSLSAPLSAALVADVRPSLSVETSLSGSILPTSPCVGWDLLARRSMSPTGLLFDSYFFYTGFSCNCFRNFEFDVRTLERARIEKRHFSYKYRI